jgi:valyl-tRNA synthetase
VDEESLADFKSIQSLIRSIRNARSDYNVEAGKKIGAIIKCDGRLRASLEAERASLSLLGRIDEAALVLEDFKSPAPSAQSVHLVVEDGLEAFLPLAGLVDKQKEVARLTKQAEKLLKDIMGLESRLESKGFADKAPEAMVAEVRANLADKKEQVISINKSIEKVVSA